ncbi:hypothetical protein [Pararhodospirillum oryzae]|uniref:hypothetical protein n=1 Tax=Pararhodospirillum oryzae TaxID=478448 RepID=UPI0011BF2932|nr:hypothetical protein [Pararhodospirillum oryzae]
MSRPEAVYLAERALAGDAVLRKGAAEVLGHNVIEFPAFCSARLPALFDDPDSKVREAASGWMRRVRERGTLAPLKPVADGFLSNVAFVDDPEDFFWMLESVSDAPPALLFEAAHRFLDRAGPDSADIRTRDALVGHRIGTLVLRAYRQAEGDRSLRLHCLDLFDRLVACGTHGAEEALERWDEG